MFTSEKDRQSTRLASNWQSSCLSSGVRSNGIRVAVRQWDNETSFLTSGERSRSVVCYSVDVSSIWVALAVSLGIHPSCGTVCPLFLDSAFHCVTYIVVSYQGKHGWCSLSVFVVVYVLFVCWIAPKVVTLLFTFFSRLENRIFLYHTFSC